MLLWSCDLRFLCTVHFEMGAVPCTARWIIGDASILSGVFSPDSGYRQGRDSIPQRGDTHSVAYL